MTRSWCARSCAAPEAARLPGERGVRRTSGIIARAEDPADLLIIDMTMPDIDGAEVLRRLRAAGSKVPVIISSGYLDVSLELRLPRGQFQGFLAKPYGAANLCAAMEQALAHA